MLRALPVASSSPSSSPSASPSPSELVRLNIGGIRYYTTRGTLCFPAPLAPSSSPRKNEPATPPQENFFTALLSGRMPVVKDEEGFIFIDRPGELFRPVLRYLQTGLWKGDEDACAEAAFYGVKVPGVAAYGRKNNAYFQELAAKTLQRRHQAIVHDITQIESHLCTLIDKFTSWLERAVTDASMSASSLLSLSDSSLTLPSASHPLTSPLITPADLTNPNQAGRRPAAVVDAWNGWLWTARRGILIEFPDHVLQVACEHQRSIECWVKEMFDLSVRLSFYFLYFSLQADGWKSEGLEKAAGKAEELRAAPQDNRVRILMAELTWNPRL